MSSDLLPTFISNLEALAVARTERVLIAVSGGPDSMALLHLFFRWNSGQIGVFHLNHGFRKSAAREAQFVRDYAQSLEVPACIAFSDLPGRLLITGESKQQGARAVRYRLLLDHAEQEGYDLIALGHQADDQAETVLMRLLRGSGLQGLGGIPPRRGPFIRPLLTVRREEILEYCSSFGVPHVEDESNLQPVYLRNQIRLELLPQLIREYNPELVSRLVELADLAREDERELQRRAIRICRRQMRRLNGQLLFPRAAFTELSLSMQRRVLRTLLFLYQGHLLDISFGHIEKWRYLLLRGAAFRLSLPGIWVSATVETIFVGSYHGHAWTAQELSIPGQVKAGPQLIRAEVFLKKNLTPRPSNCEDFDLGQLALPLEVRPRRPGDRLELFGGAGTKKLKDMLIDAHIPREQRDFLAVICDQRGILWVPSVRRNFRGLLDENTKRVLRLSCKANHG